MCYCDPKKTVSDIKLRVYSANKCMFTALGFAFGDLREVPDAKWMEEFKERKRQNLEGDHEMDDKDNADVDVDRWEYAENPDHQFADTAFLELGVGKDLENPLELIYAPYAGVCLCLLVVLSLLVLIYSTYALREMFGCAYVYFRT